MVVLLVLLDYKMQMVANMSTYILMGIFLEMDFWTSILHKKMYNFSFIWIIKRILPKKICLYLTVPAT